MLVCRCASPSSISEEKKTQRRVEQRAARLLDRREPREQVRELLDLPGVDRAQHREVRRVALVVRDLVVAVEDAEPRDRSGSSRRCASMNVMTRVRSHWNASTIRSLIARDARRGSRPARPAPSASHGDAARGSGRAARARARRSGTRRASGDPSAPSSRRRRVASSRTASSTDRRCARRRSRSAGESCASAPWKSRSNAETGFVSFASGLCGPAHEMLRA